MKRIIALSVLLLVASSGLALSQEQEKPELEQLMYKAKYSSVRELVVIVRNRVSEFGRVTSSRENNLIIIEDTPEKIEEIKTVFAAMDVKPDSILLSIYLFWADDVDADSSLPENVTPDIKEALSEVTSLMPYNSFEAMGRGAIQLSATAERGRIKVNDNTYVSFRSKYTQTSKFLVLESFAITRTSEGEGEQIFRTDITLSAGEITVAGITRPNGTNKAIVSIVKMKVK
jgi:type II secretory pathway component GspD/PulD (secretin)